MKNDHDMMAPPPHSAFLDSYVKLNDSRIIFLSENITKQSAADLSAFLLYYDNVNHELPITIYINTNGGDAAGLSNIYDVMHMIKAPIRTINIGKCYSAGSVILASGTKGERCALKNSKIMIHGIQCGFPIPGFDVRNSKNYFEFLNDNNDNIMKMLARHTGHTLAKVKSDFLRDVWFSPPEALKYGIIDKIL